jgi:hypothetical protein
MEHNSLIMPGTSYCDADAGRDSSTGADAQREITDLIGDFDNLSAVVLPERIYRVLAGRLYVVRPGSPPGIES